MKKPTALISVYNKTGIVEFARELAGLGFNLLSSGGTAKVLREGGLDVKDVAELVGEPILGHRVVTLSREIHAALLSRDTPEDNAELERIGIPRIDLVCVDLYPLKEEIAKKDATLESVIEKTDIGGPTMIRSAAKGRRIVIADAMDRQRVIDLLKSPENGPEGLMTGLKLWSLTTELCAKAEGIVANYCLASARYHSNSIQLEDTKKPIDGFIGTRTLECKYGENAWQTPAGLYSTGTDDLLALDKFELIAGTPPSYNNLCDLDRMLQTATHIAASFKAHTLIALAVKHGNPCGASIDVLFPPVVGYGDAVTERLLERMIDGDKRAIFGGLVITTFPVEEKSAETLLTHGMKGGRRVLDGIIAPGFSSGAIELLKRKGDKCRFIVNPALHNLSHTGLDAKTRFRYVRGGFLRQPNYTFVPDWDKLGLRYEDAQDARLAWAIGSTSNSNTITLVKNGMLIGNGVGQQDRVGCCELALKRARDAKHDPKGAVAYSDSFFPFPDGPQALIDAGVRAIFATSGSVRDNETRAVCEKAGVRLYLLPDAEARGFYGH